MRDLNRNFQTEISDELLEGVFRGSRAHLARAISLVEDGAGQAVRLLSRAYKRRRKAAILGITGSPGVGKSTVASGLVKEFRSLDHSVGVIAVDPTSPFTGGAILGDRVRLRTNTTDDGVYWRSLATRGHLGGVSRHTGDVITLMDAYGFDDIVVETVGAGQSEVDIMKYAETVVVVLAPNLGDDVQAIKAGILEIGDVFCLNKADLPGAEGTRRDIEMMLNLKEETGWRPPVIMTQADTGQGLDDLVKAVMSHKEYLVSTGLLDKKARESHLAILKEYLNLLTVEKVIRSAETDGTLERALQDLSSGNSDPLTCASELLERHLKEKPIVSF
jgi:LAO/AO transport system kinase